MQREGWESLNGEWDAALDVDARWTIPDEVTWNRRIVVPFCPEAPLSGINDHSFFQAVWYRRVIECPSLGSDQRWLLHFGAVDYRATVWVNGRLVGQHVGGYTPFAVDLTSCLPAVDRTSRLVRAEDDPHDLAKPRGKQDWQLRTAFDLVSAHHRHLADGVARDGAVDTASATSAGPRSLERWEIGFEAWIDGEPRERPRLDVKLQVGEPAARR